MTTDATCPYCNKPLVKSPKRKKQCPHCGEYMYVRGGKPYTENQVKEHDFLRSWLGRLEDHYGVSEADFEGQRRELSKQFGFRAGSHDTVWRVLNNQITKIPTYPTNEHRTIYLDMANFVQAEGKDPCRHIESANKVQSDINRKSVSEEINIFDLPPGTKWVAYTDNDVLVCPICKEAEKGMSKSEAISLPLRCLSDNGCRCEVFSDYDSFSEEEPRATSHDSPELDDPGKVERRPWWQFWRPESPEEH